MFVGLPDDSQSSYLRGCAAAPKRIRKVYDGDSFNGTTEGEIDLRGRVQDLGDLRSRRTWSLTAAHYREVAEGVFRRGAAAFFAGGDHAVSVPVVAALAVLGRPVHVLQVDAHPDLYPEFRGSKSSHACVAARFLEMPHVASLTQLGIRTRNAEQRELAARYEGRLHQHTARELGAGLPVLDHVPPNGLAYLTVDADGLDPSNAPAVAHPVPGGLTVRFVLDLIHHGAFRLIGMDVVEVNPSRDVNDITSIVAGRLLHEGMGRAIATLETSVR